jgi:hypothetical protein
MPGTGPADQAYRDKAADTVVRHPAVAVESLGRLLKTTSKIILGAWARGLQQRPGVLFLQTLPQGFPAFGDSRRPLPLKARLLIFTAKDGFRCHSVSDALIVDLIQPNPHFNRMLRGVTPEKILTTFPIFACTNS